MAETAIQRYERLKSAVARQRERVAELRGERTSLLARLRDEFGCESIEDAERKLRKAKDKHTALMSQFEELLDGLETEIAGSK